MQARSEPVSQGGYVRDMHVVRYLWLVLDVSFELSVSISEQPLEDCLLNLLVIFLFKELILDEHHRSQDEQLASFRAHVKGPYWSVSWITDGSAR